VKYINIIDHKRPINKEVFTPNKPLKKEVSPTLESNKNIPFAPKNSLHNKSPFDPKII